MQSCAALPASLLWLQGRRTWACRGQARKAQPQAAAPRENSRGGPGCSLAAALCAALPLPPPAPMLGKKMRRPTYSLRQLSPVLQTCGRVGWRRPSSAWQASSPSPSQRSDHAEASRSWRHPPALQGCTGYAQDVFGSLHTANGAHLRVLGARTSTILSSSHKGTRVACKLDHPHSTFNFNSEESCSTRGTVCNFLGCVVSETLHAAT